MVKFEEVTKCFGSTIALDKVSFEVDKGEFVYITGPSGAGKTTIIKLLLRDVQPDTGRVLIEDKDIATLKPSEVPFYRRNIGVVFQDFKLLPDRTVEENTSLALEVLGEDVEERKISEVLEMVGMSDKAKLFPRQLAGGEQQRAVIARALITHPKLILADEPTGNLDPVTSRQIVEILNTAAKSGTTVLMATHNEIIVNSIKQRVLKFNKGKLLSDKHGKYEEE